MVRMGTKNNRHLELHRLSPLPLCDQALESKRVDGCSECVLSASQEREQADTVHQFIAE